MTPAERTAARALLAAASTRPWRTCDANANGPCPCGLVWSIPLDASTVDAQPRDVTPKEPT